MTDLWTFKDNNTNPDSLSPGLKEKYLDRFVIPEGISEVDQAKLHQAFLQALIFKVAALNDKVDQNIATLNGQSNRSIEVIGIFSAIVALLIIDTNIIKSADNFSHAMLLLVGLTSSLVVFVALLHTFFNPDANSRPPKSFWLAISILAGLAIFAGLFDSLQSHVQFDMSTGNSTSTLTLSR